MEVVRRRGFDATVEEIAKLSGVSPRTIFRHYESHDGLIASTVKDMFEACGLPRLTVDLEVWIEDLMEDVKDLDSWIDYIALMFHTRSASIFGAAFWDIHAPRRRASEALHEVDVLRRDYRLRGMGELVRVVWRMAGGRGDPPDDLVKAFALNLSVFTTQALTVDFDQSPEQIGALTAEILKTLLWRAVGPEGPGDAVGSRHDGGDGGAVDDGEWSHIRA